MFSETQLIEEIREQYKYNGNIYLDQYYDNNDIELAARQVIIGSLQQESKYSEANELIFDWLLEKYRGLRRVDLCEMNTCYSCIICKKYYNNTCESLRAFSSNFSPEERRRNCPNHEKISEEEFAKVYDF